MSSILNHYINFFREKKIIVDDIFHYIEALDYGTKRLADFPMSMRVIKEIHKVLMDNARSSHFSNP